MRKQFKYRKPNGDESFRDVFIISPPSESYFTIDLSEFTELEREEYTEALEEGMLYLKDIIRECGLANNYRNFRRDRIVTDD